MTEEIKFNKLFGITGPLFALTGLALLGLFASHAFSGNSPVPTDGIGHYFIAFTGSMAVCWGAILAKAARRPEVASVVALPTAVGLALMSVYRIIVTFTNEDVMDWVGYVPAGEAVIFGILAIVFFTRRTA